MVSVCNVNGKIVPEAEASVPIMDRGFLFGDSIYEVTKTVLGCPFAWPEHLERLHRSADGLKLALNLSDGELTRRTMATVAASGTAPQTDERYIRVIITRGLTRIPNIDTRHAIGTPTTIVMVRPLPEQASSTAHLSIVRRLQNDRRALDPAIKSGSYLNNVMGLAEAQAQGATDCVFLNQDGRITEASTSNIWLMQGETISTPALGAGLLEGVTRRLLIEMCTAQSIRCVEKDLFEADLNSADGVFLTSSLRGIAPVTHLNGRPIGSGTPSQALLAVMRDFAEFCDHKVHTIYRPAVDRLVAAS